MDAPFPKESLPHSVSFALRLAREDLQRQYSGAVHDFPLFRSVDVPIDGFFVQQDGGLTLVFVDATRAVDGGQWIMQICAGLGVDVPDVGGPLAWVNRKNRESSVDRYYCAVRQDDAGCAVAAETTVSSLLLNSMQGAAAMPIIGQVRSLLRNAIYTAAHDGPEVRAAHGGRAFALNGHDMMNLFAVAGG